MPGGMPLVHSLVLSEFELLVAKDVVETASRRGEAIGGLSLDDRVAGLMSGDWIGGEGLEERALPFPLLADGQLETLPERARSDPRELGSMLRYRRDNSTAFFAILLVLLRDYQRRRHQFCSRAQRGSQKDMPPPNRRPKSGNIDGAGIHTSSGGRAGRTYLALNGNQGDGKSSSLLTRRLS
jgi:hypothetical protein